MSCAIYEDFAESDHPGPELRIFTMSYAGDLLAVSVSCRYLKPRGLAGEALDRIKGGEDELERYLLW